MYLRWRDFVSGVDVFSGVTGYLGCRGIWLEWVMGDGLSVEF